MPPGIPRANIPSPPFQWALAANQGLYNGFIAVGLFWGLLHPAEPFGREIQAFFLACVAVAGVVGAGTTGQRNIVFIQSVPALAALGALWAL
jgi:putative membrane protein